MVSSSYHLPYIIPHWPAYVVGAVDNMPKGYRISNLGKWSEEDKNYVIQNYRHNWESAQQVANVLKRTPIAVQCMAGTLHLYNRIRKNWSKKEDEFLVENYAQKSMHSLVNYLKRSRNSIYCRAEYLGIVRHNRNDCFTIQELVTALGVAHRTIRSWADSGQLRCETEKADGGPVFRYRVTRQNLKAFLKKHPLELQGKNVDMVWLIDVLTAPNGY